MFMTRDEEARFEEAHATEHYCVDPYECRICTEEREEREKENESENEIYRTYRKTTRYY